MSPLALDIVQTIQYAMATDDTDQSERIVHQYESAAPEHKAVINELLIALCGYSMPSLIALAKGEEPC